MPKIVNAEIISLKNGTLNVPDNPIVPFIEGDGTGPDRAWCCFVWAVPSWTLENDRGVVMLTDEQVETVIQRIKEVIS